jgi:DNA-binding response OmpR family regulator
MVAESGTGFGGPRVATPATILIVQDDFLAAERLRLLLAEAGHKVVGLARRTAEASELAAQHQPDLAIVDMMLEVDVDGIRTATALAREHDMKILITTGFPDSVIQAEGVPDLACAILKKPYTDEDVLAAVARCLA